MSDRPNVLVILVDQQRADMAGCYGNSFCQTPHLDALARTGTVFTRAYCPFPQCSPTRASLMTGLDPIKTGIGIQSNYRMLGDRTVERLDTELPSIGTLLHEAGYRTGYVGKWHLSPKEPPTDLVDYGFDSYEAQYPRLTKLVPCAPEAGLHKKGIAGFGTSTPSWEGWQAARAEEFIRRNAGAGEPFLLFYSEPRPHPPYFVTREDFEKWAPADIPLWGNIHDDLKNKPLAHRRLRENILDSDAFSEEVWLTVLRHYAALTSAADADMGRVLTALDDSGIRDDTLVVYMSDHGDLCGAHGFLSKGAVAYEELLRIPFVVRWPGHTEPGTVCDALTSPMDVLPTLAQAAGIAMPEGLDGRSLAPLLSGEMPVDWRRRLFVTHHGNSYGLCTTRAVIGPCYKYVYYPYDVAELYDRERDPWEMDNRVGDPALRHVVAEMHGALVEHTHSRGDRFTIAERPGPAPDGKGASS